jgi:hypothetical protein
VPATQFARFTDDPDQVKRTLCAAGFLKRADGGWQIVTGNGITLTNANDTMAEAAEQQAVEDAERSAKSAGGKRGNHERWHERPGKFLPGCEFCEVSAPQERAETKRTSHSDRIAIGSDSDATPIDRSRSDLDLSPVSPKQNRRRPAARDGDPSPGSHAFRIAVTAKFAAVAKVDIGPETADAIASDVLDGKKHVDHKLLYVLTAIDNEANPVGRWLPGYQRPEPRKPDLPEWCGKCDKYDRRLTNDAGQITGHCPDCSPRSFAAWEAIAS